MGGDSFMVSPSSCSCDMSLKLLLLDGFRDSWQPNPLHPSVLGAAGGEDESDTGALRIFDGRRAVRDPIGEAAATASRTCCHPPAGCQYFDNLGSFKGCGVGGCIKDVKSVWWSDEASSGALFGQNLSVVRELPLT